MSNSKIQLRVYVQPGQAEVFINIRRKDGGYHKQAAIVDTGAQISLLPPELMASLDYRLSENGQITVEQAGIAQQAFQAIEAFVTLHLEDGFGNRTAPTEVRVWFAKTRKVLVGFDGVLERAVLHLDAPRLTGYLEFE